MNWGHPERGKILLLAGDFLLAAAGVILATMIEAGRPISSPSWAGLIAAFAVTYSICFYIFDLYDVQALNGSRTITRLLTAAFCGTCILSFSFYLFQWPEFSRGSMAISVPFLVASSYAWRSFYKKHRSSLFRSRTVLMVGTSEDALNLNAILESKQSGYELCGLLRNGPCESATDNGDLSGIPLSVVAAASSGGKYEIHGNVAVEEARGLEPMQGAPEITVAVGGIQDFGVVSRAKLEELTSTFEVDTIVIRQNFAVAELAESLTRLRFQGVKITTLPDLCGQILEELPLDTLSDSWLSFATGFNVLHVRVFRRIKRLADILLACLGLILTLPISAVVAIAIKLESPGPVLFRQWRVGWKEKPFTLLKFRSMRQDAESDGKEQWASAEDSRATRAGRILRRLHIDEIPQMFNVLLGEMSFVGPRPERPVFVEQLKHVVPFYSLRHHLPPGITGWAQVNYPYGASVEDAKRKLQFDLFYVRNASPTMDLRILLRTARVILFRRGSR